MKPPVLIAAATPPDPDLVARIARVEGAHPTVVNIPDLRGQLRRLPRARLWIDRDLLGRLPWVLGGGGILGGGELGDLFEVVFFDPRYGQIDPDTTGGFVGWGSGGNPLPANQNQIHDLVAVGRLFKPDDTDVIGTLLMDRSTDTSRPWSPTTDNWHFRPGGSPFPSQGFDVRVGNAAGAWEAHSGTYHCWSDDALEPSGATIPPAGALTTRYRVHEVPNSTNTDNPLSVWMQVTPSPGGRFVQTWYAAPAALTDGRFAMHSDRRYRFVPTNADLSGIASPQAAYLGIGAMQGFGT